MSHRLRRLLRPATILDVPDPERMLRAIRCSAVHDADATTRRGTNESAALDLDWKGHLSMLADQVVSEERPVSEANKPAKKIPGIAHTGNIQDAIASIQPWIEDTLANMVNPASEKQGLQDSRTAAGLQAIIDRAIRTELHSVQFDIRLRRTIDEIVSSPQYLLKVTVAILNTDDFLTPVAPVVKSAASKALKAAQKRQERKTKLLAALSTSTRSPPPSDPPPTDVSDARKPRTHYLADTATDRELEWKQAEYRARRKKGSIGAR